MVQRVMGRDHVATTLQLYVRRTEQHDRIRKALNGTTGANFTSLDGNFAALDTNERGRMFPKSSLTALWIFVPQTVCAGGRYWDRTSDLFGVNADWLCLCMPVSDVVSR
jgi:hypothetical protein